MTYLQTPSVAPAHEETIVRALIVRGEFTSTDIEDLTQRLRRYEAVSRWRGITWPAEILPFTSAFPDRR
jgi:hypothetical protein